MSRLPLTLVVPDASLFAKSLGQSLKTRHAAEDRPPPLALSGKHQQRLAAQGSPAA